ncbi:MAG TPA: dethiobiotin synthase [Anaerolineae bacterium]|nr:dethiobiotin synthase [Anaerolineae bacterium]
MKNKSLFITGTNTGIGKTVICGCLARYLSRKGINVGIQKWVSTGNRNTSDDMDCCLSMLGREKEDIDNPLLLHPYTFDFPASPHLAAEMEGKEIDINKIAESYHTLVQRHDLLIVEGVGGVLVPLTQDRLLIDLVADLAIPVLIVTDSGLGTINHTLLTIEALTKRGIPILGMVFNFAGKENKIIEADNIKTISRIGKRPSFGSLSRVDSTEALIAEFEPIGKNILKALNRSWEHIIL